MESGELARPFLPWIGRACRQAREESRVKQVKSQERIRDALKRLQI